MGKSCSAVGCTRRFKKGDKGWTRLPSEESEPERREKWITALRRENWTPGKHSWLCGAHFIGGAKSDEPLLPDYVPRVFTFVRSPVKRKMQEELEAYHRRAKRTRLFADQSATKAVESTAATPTPDPAESASTSKSCQTDLTMGKLHDLESEKEQLKASVAKLQARVTELELENATLKLKQPSYGYTEDNFKNDPAKVHYYTGLPEVKILSTVFSYVSKPLSAHGHSKLSLFQQFILVLMKLRLNLAHQDLAYRFGISPATVTKIFEKWIQVMFVRLRPLIRWPNHGDLEKTMPRSFRGQFGRCVCIIDCFEVFMERPRNLMARALTFSHYKSHNTVKFLVAVTPQGSISFISKAWGGRTPDKHLTENCGLLKLLNPGDQVMADRGFTIEDSVGMYCAKLVIPSFTRGKKQLRRQELEQSRQIANVRIHVERVIGLLRQKYTILQSTLHITLLKHDTDEKESMIDRIVSVCCALCNCCKSVVPLN